MGSIIKSQYSDMEDRISNLPVHVAHHILSFLKMKELSRLCVTSKKHRELCLSVPFLTFDGVQYRSSAKRARFINFLDRFISLRKGMETRQVSIRWSFKKVDLDEEYRVLTWLNFAIGCRVELLELEFILDKEGVFFLPLGVLHCESLMKLKLNLHGGILKFPSPNGLSMLQSVSLDDTKIHDETFREWVSSLCKHLKELSLVNIRGMKSISIESSTLQLLIIKNFLSSDLCNVSVAAAMLEHMTLFWRFDSSSGKSLKVVAPKLVYFNWQGSPINFHFLGKMDHLQTVMILFKPYPLSEGNGVSNNRNLAQLFHSVCSVSIETLYLDGESLKVLYKQGCLSMLVLNNLCSLHIITNDLNDDMVPATACLLKGAPSLSNISIQYHKFLGERPSDTLPYNPYGFTREYWESQNLMLIDHLKVASIEIFHKVDNDLELIKYLLKHAKFLKKMTIFHSSSYPDICREVNNYEKISAAEVVFCPKPEILLKDI